MANTKLTLTDTDTTSGRILAVIGNLPYRSLIRAGVELRMFAEAVSFDDSYKLGLEVVKSGIRERAESLMGALTLYHSGVNPEEIIRQQLTSMATSISPFVHEWDPRIGSSVTLHRGAVQHESWPYCPLFDRKDKEDLMIFSKLRSGRTADLSCPVCKKNLANDNSPHQVLVWAGGNLCWIHDWCSGGNFTGL